MSAVAKQLKAPTSMDDPKSDQQGNGHLLPASNLIWTPVLDCLIRRRLDTFANRNAPPIAKQISESDDAH